MVTMTDGLSGQYIADGITNINTLVTGDAITQHMEYDQLNDTMSESEITVMARSLTSICAARTKPTKNNLQGRKGAKAVKRLERLESKSHALSPDEATMYRAIDARAKYLAQLPPPRHRVLHQRVV